MFTDSILHFHLRTGLKTSDGKSHWYQLDLAFPEIKLAVEIDGGVHRRPERVLGDKKRTGILNALGWTVLRFWNDQVTKDSLKVKADIQSTILKLRAIQVIP